MNRVAQGIVAGLVFGILDVLIMVPLPFPDKTAAMLGAFINRFAIGFFIAIVDIPVPWILKGLIVGTLLSLPDAIITKAYAPILGIGILGGVIIGFVLSKI